MCELLAITTKNNSDQSNCLKKFYNERGQYNPHGWGLCAFSDDNSLIDKEPVKACHSKHLSKTLEAPLISKNTMAHVRFATTGARCYEDCHPFQYKDDSGRTWTLVHNGTIFKPDMINEITLEQEGDTDSERVLLLIIEGMNKKIKELNRELTDSERFEVLDGIIQNLSEGNKLNLMAYDGDLLYIHSNVEDMMYISPYKDGFIIGSREYDFGDFDWKPFPKKQLIAFRDGQKVFEGHTHENWYIDDPVYSMQLYLKYLNI